MFNKPRTILALLLALSSAANADDIQLGNPGYGGSGCPAGSVSATLSPDAKTLSILFDSYMAEAGGGTGKTMDRKSCNLAIPVHVPQGLSVSIIGLDYRGYTYVPRNAEARFDVQYFLAGSVGPRFQKSFLGPVDSEYLIHNDLLATAIVWSPCGQDVNLRVNSSMIARTNPRNQQTLATVDSADVQAGIIYQLQWRQCW